MADENNEHDQPIDIFPLQQNMIAQYVPIVQNVPIVNNVPTSTEQNVPTSPPQISNSQMNVYLNDDWKVPIENINTKSNVIQSTLNDNDNNDTTTIDNQITDNQIIGNQITDNQVISNQMSSNQMINTRSRTDQSIPNQVIDNQIVINEQPISQRDNINIKLVNESNDNNEMSKDRNIMTTLLKTINLNVHSLDSMNALDKNLIEICIKYYFYNHNYRLVELQNNLICSMYNASIEYSNNLNFIFTDIIKLRNEKLNDKTPSNSTATGLLNTSNISNAKYAKVNNTIQSIKDATSTFIIEYFSNDLLLIIIMMVLKSYNIELKGIFNDMNYNNLSKVTGKLIVGNEQSHFDQLTMIDITLDKYLTDIQIPVKSNSKSSNVLSSYDYLNLQANDYMRSNIINNLWYNTYFKVDTKLVIGKYCSDTTVLQYITTLLAKNLTKNITRIVTANDK